MISFLGEDTIPVSLGPDTLGWVAPKKTGTRGIELIVRLGEQSFELNVEELLLHINTSRHGQNRGALSWLRTHRRFTVILPDNSLEIYSGYVRLLNDSTLTTLFNALSRFGKALRYSINSELNSYEQPQFMLAYRELRNLHWAIWADPTWRGIDLDKMVRDSSVRWRSYKKLDSAWISSQWRNCYNFSSFELFIADAYAQGQTNDGQPETAFLFVQSEDEGFSKNEHTLDGLSPNDLINSYFPHSKAERIELFFFHANNPLADWIGQPLIPLTELSELPSR